MDVFEGSIPLAGLEPLGRHIRDPFGVPSGSPANFEALRGRADPSEMRMTQGEIDRIIATTIKALQTMGVG